jgi:glycosyltransferase involved in cell wall biosynthesis
LSVAEAMMCGTPVIAFNRGSMKELIEDGKTGFLISNTEEAIAAVKKLATICRCDCRTHSLSKFSSRVMALKYIKLYKQVIRNAHSL